MLINLICSLFDKEILLKLKKIFSGDSFMGEVFIVANFPEQFLDCCITLQEAKAKYKDVITKAIQEICVTLCYG
eukprot:snap_masked-scaffold_19-processed-gene-0.15-mRNA-1 protein AED:1.00 eAED:1.00 QI:0/-1/0/0/-1/1/1/0/73